MVKRLAGLLQGVIVEDILGQEDISITGIAADSRKVTPGCIFVAVPGTRSEERRVGKECGS